MEKVADKEELLLLLDDCGNPTNKLEKRSAVHSKGLWHREIGFIPINKQKQILLQRRSKNKKSYPNCWALCAGHVVGKQTTLQAAVMEANEELGLNLKEQDLILLVAATKNEREDNKCFATCYYCKMDLPIYSFKKQDEEVEELKWVDIATFEQMIKSEKGCIFKNNAYYQLILNALKNIKFVEFKQYFEQYYEALKNMYVDEITYHKDFKQVKSNIIDDGIWNFVYDIKAKNYKDFIKVFEKTKRLFIDRVPRFYVLKSDENSQYLDKIKKDYDLYCEDSWFCTPLDKLYLNYKARIDVKVEISNDKEEIIDCIMDGFSTHDPSDPYGDLSPTYRESLNKKLFSKDCKYQTIHYVARYNNKIISIASITIVGKSAFLNNVTTLKDYKGKAISKEILTFAINDLKTKNIENIIFATETGAYTEAYYKKLGFDIVDYGYCFEEKN